MLLENRVVSVYIQSRAARTKPRAAMVMRSNWRWCKDDRRKLLLALMMLDDVAYDDGMSRRIHHRKAGIAGSLSLGNPTTP